MTFWLPALLAACRLDAVLWRDIDRVLDGCARVLPHYSLTDTAANRFSAASLAFPPLDAAPDLATCAMRAAAMSLASEDPS